MVDGARVFLLRTTMRENRACSCLLRSSAGATRHAAFKTSILSTPRADQRTLYDGFLLHSTKVFGPRSKASRSPLLQTAIFSSPSRTFVGPSLLLLKHPVSNKQSTRKSRSFCFCHRKAVFALSKAELRQLPLPVSHKTTLEST